MEYALLAWSWICQGFAWLLSNWLELLKALAAPIIAGAALKVSRQQVRINESKLRLDLYDRRMDAYSAVKTFLGAFWINGNISQADLTEFRSGTVQVDFLFDDAVHSYVAELDSNARRLIVCYSAHRRGIRGTSQKKAAFDEIEELNNWFAVQPARAKQVFKPFLKLEPPPAESQLARIRRKLTRQKKESRP